jgi:hypothetical protein
MAFVNARNWLGRTALASSGMTQGEGKCNKRKQRKKIGTKEPTPRDHPVCSNWVASSAGRSAKEIIIINNKCVARNFNLQLRLR